MQNLPDLVDKAARALQGARSHAEILAAKDMAGAVYTMARTTARLARAKDAHDELIKKLHKTQADAIEIEAGAQIRLADEYDAAQKAGEVAKHGQKRADIPNGNISTDLGIDPKEIHLARQLRDAEKSDPGIVRRHVKAGMDDKEGPTKTRIRKAIVAAATAAMNGTFRKKNSNRNPLHVKQSDADKAWTHVYGECRAFVEWATAANVRLTMEGLARRSDDQRANISAVRKCIGAMTTIMEKIDAR